MTDAKTPTSHMDTLYAQAAEFQRFLPGATLVGGSAIAYYCHHRRSDDHDHVLPNLHDNYDSIVDTLNNVDGWQLSRTASNRPNTILGTYKDYMAGVRQLRRKRPLQTQAISVGAHTLTLPTLNECARIKLWMLTQRQHLRDFVDVAALTDIIGVDDMRNIVNQMDDYYTIDASVKQMTLIALVSDFPRDKNTVAHIKSYKNILPPYDDWRQVTTICRQLI